MEDYKCFIEFYSKNSYSIYTNIITTLIGAFFGLGFSLFIYYKQTKKEKKKEKEIKKALEISIVSRNEQNNKDLLKYYSVLIKKMLLIIDKELELLDEYILKQNENFSVLQLYPKVPSYDAQRLKSIDNRGLFEAWTSIFSDKDIITQYQRTNSAIDIIDGVITETHKIHSTINNNYYSKLYEVKEIIDNIPYILSSIAFEMHKELGDKRKDDKFYTHITNSIIQYHKLTNSGKSITYFIEHMITPLLEETYKNHKENINAIEIMMLCRKVRAKFNDVALAITFSLNDFGKARNKVEESICILNESVKKINNVL